MARQYPDFNALKESFNGLVDVIGVPCTQFLNVSLTEKNVEIQFDLPIILIRF